jgi:hypothetical protein
MHDMIARISDMTHDMMSPVSYDSDVTQATRRPYQ